jgi:hypothetical protein
MEATRTTNGRQGRA